MTAITMIMGTLAVAGIVAGIDLLEAWMARRKVKKGPTDAD